MLKNALKRLTPTQKPLLHSDQGWHYQMPVFRRTLHEHGLEQSMSRKGNCLDNALMENFFGILKTEFFHGKRFESVTFFIKELKAYLRYYNHDRIKLKLKGLSPVQYRIQSFNWPQRLCPTVGVQFTFTDRALWRKQILRRVFLIKDQRVTSRHSWSRTTEFVVQEGMRKSAKKPVRCYSSP